MPSEFFTDSAPSKKEFLFESFVRREQPRGDDKSFGHNKKIFFSRKEMCYMCSQEALKVEVDEKAKEDCLIESHKQKVII
jgi:hypothetical protein